MGRRENGFGTEGTGDVIGPGTGGSVSPPPGAVVVSICSTSDALPGAVASTDAVGLLEFSDAVGVLADTPALSDAVGVHSCVAATSDAVGVLSRTAALSDAVGVPSHIGALPDAAAVSTTCELGGSGAYPPLRSPPMILKNPS